MMRLVGDIRSIASSRGPTGGAARGTLWTAGGLVVSTLATLGANLFAVAKTLPTTFADLVILTAIVLMVGMVARLGANQIIIGEVHAVEARLGPSNARLAGADILAFVIASAILCALVLTATPAVRLVDLPLSTELRPGERVLVALWFAGEVVRIVVGEAYRSRYQFMWASIAGYGLRAPLFLAMMAIVSLKKPPPIPRADILMAASVSSLVVCVSTLVSISSAFPWWRGNPLRSARQLWRGHVWMLTATFAASLIGSADIWVMGATAPPNVRASYGLSVTLVAGIPMVATAITGGILPYVAAAVATGNVAAIQQRIVGFVRAALALALVAFVGLLIFSAPLATALGGPSYADITLFIAVLGGGQVINVLMGVGGAVLIVSRQYRAVTLITVGVSIAAVMGEAAFGFLVGAPVGIAITSGAATAILPILGAVALHRSLRMRTDALAPPVRAAEHTQRWRRR